MVVKNHRDNIKRIVGVVLTIVLFALYYLTTDPDAKIIQNLKMGVGLILTLNIFFTAMMGIIIIEFFPDFFIDLIYGDEKVLREKAMETAQGAGQVLIAKSIRMFAFAVIMAAAIITLSPN